MVKKTHIHPHNKTSSIQSFTASIQACKHDEVTPGWNQRLNSLDCGSIKIWRVVGFSYVHWAHLHPTAGATRLWKIDFSDPEQHTHSFSQQLDREQARFWIVKVVHLQLQQQHCCSLAKALLKDNLSLVQHFIPLAIVSIRIIRLCSQRLTSGNMATSLKRTKTRQRNANGHMTRQVLLNSNDYPNLTWKRKQRGMVELLPKQNSSLNYLLFQPTILTAVVCTVFLYNEAALPTFQICPISV